MNIFSAFPSKYLKASDIPPGREAFVKINTVQMEAMETSGDEKPVAYFINREKGLVLNVTNSNTIADAYSPDTETWHGQPVVLFSTTTSFGGKQVPCLRVKIPPKPATAPVPAPVPQNDLDAANAQLNEEGDASQTDIPF